MSEDFPAPTSSGLIPFSHPSLSSPSQTFFKLFGDLTSKPAQPPLIVLHGGPGSGHEYVFPFSKLYIDHSIPVILYDQIGCGASTHYRDKLHDHTFWTIDLFIAELQNLLSHFGLGKDRPFDLLGHSFGGVVVASFAARQPQGLRKLVLASPAVSAETFVSGAWKLLSRVSQKSQDAVRHAIDSDDYTAQEFKDAGAEWMHAYLCHADPFPGPYLGADLKNQADDPTVVQSMVGKCAWKFEGSIKSFDLTSQIGKIMVPTLLTRGEFDTCHEDTTRPFVDGIADIKAVEFKGASHMNYQDSPEMEEKVITTVLEFLNDRK